MTLLPIPATAIEAKSHHKPVTLSFPKNSEPVTIPIEASGERWLASGREGTVGRPNLSPCNPPIPIEASGERWLASGREGTVGRPNLSPCNPLLLAMLKWELPDQPPPRITPAGDLELPKASLK